MILDEIREKRKRKRAKKTGYCKRSGFQLPFSALFHNLFCSLYLFMQSGCFYGSSKVLKCSKRTGVIFSGFYSSLGYIYPPNMKKGGKKGAKKGHCE
jgi:hypothetical protein